MTPLTSDRYNTSTATKMQLSSRSPTSKPVFGKALEVFRFLLTVSKVSLREVPSTN